MVRALKRHLNGIDVKEASLGGLELLEIMSGYEKVILIDAIQTGGNDIGALVKIRPEDLPGGSSMARHQVSLVEALELGRLLKMNLPESIVIYGVEVKDVLLPQGLQRAMARQAEAEREKRAKIIHADGEYEASKQLVEAAHNISQEPISLQLRYLQTMVEMSSERSSTIIPIPIDILYALKPMMEGVKSLTGNGK